MKTFLIIIAFLPMIICSSCNAQKVVAKQQKISQGKWVCVQDSLRFIIVQDEYIYDYYENKPIDTLKYNVINKSCDTLYKPVNKQNALYIEWSEKICFEVEYLTENDLMLIYTANGKLTTFRRKKMTKQN